MQPRLPRTYPARKIYKRYSSSHALMLLKKTMLHISPNRSQHDDGQLSCYVASILPSYLRKLETHETKILNRCRGTNKKLSKTNVMFCGLAGGSWWTLGAILFCSKRPATTEPKFVKDSSDCDQKLFWNFKPRRLSRRRQISWVSHWLRPNFNANSIQNSIEVTDKGKETHLLSRLFSTIFHRKGNSYHISHATLKVMERFNEICHY